jgi:murein L,D-transpeptidase YafK
MIHPGKWLPVLACLCVGAQAAGTSIEIDKSDHRLRLIRDGKAVKEFACSLGKGGDGTKRKRGDNLTPEGEYRIVAINRKSGFHVFLHLSYPNRADIDAGLAGGLIDSSTHARLRAAADKGILPDQNTALGGQVGIHGIRNGLGWLGPLQSAVDWTQGCIAVTNGQIEELSREVAIGTRVVLKP